MLGIYKNINYCILKNAYLGIVPSQMAAYHCFNVNQPKADDVLLLNKAQSSPLKNQVRYKKIIVKRIFPTPKLPFSYEFPEKTIPMFDSMDVDQTLGKIEYSQSKLLFQLSEELKDADDRVKRLFSLEMASRREIVEHKKQELVGEVQQHELDTTSEEVKIANLTLTIRSIQEHLRQNPFDKRQKRIVLEIIGKRNSGLHKLRKLHLEKFHWLINKLGINYVRPLLAVEVRKETRKGELRRMTKEYCENIRKTRLNAYHDTLKAQQEMFLKEKEELTKFIEKEENELALIESK